MKTQSSAGIDSFAHEVRILEWLQGRLPVPEVLGFAKDTAREYLVLSEVPGQNSVQAMDFTGYDQIVELLATGLRTIHELDITGCPFDERIETKLEKAEKNLANGLVQEGYFDEERQGMTGRQVLDALHQNPPLENDLVFNHGDYCLPNIIVQEGEVSGFIDLGRAGISDRYNDLAIASRSINYNLGPSFEDLFFKTYGINKIEKEKINYYRMMDELF